MAHDVFISYIVEDERIADAVCGALEGQGIACWMAPRDVPLGMDYEEAIIDALSTARILILILTARSNNSPHVKREIQNACAEGSTTQVISLRVEDVTFSKALKYYLGSSQWLDASTPPLEDHLQRLVKFVRARLPQGTAAAGGAQATQRQPLAETAPAGAEAGQGEAVGVVPVTPPAHEVPTAKRDAPRTAPASSASDAGNADALSQAPPAPVGRRTVPLVWVAVGVVALALAATIVFLLANRKPDAGELAAQNQNSRHTDPNLAPGMNNASSTTNNTSNTTNAASNTNGPSSANVAAGNARTSVLNPPGTNLNVNRSKPPEAVNQQLQPPAAREARPRRTPSTIPTQPGTSEGESNKAEDERIYSEVKSALARHNLLDNITVIDVRGGVVTLGGTVIWEKEKIIAGELCLNVKGVTGVRNKLSVKAVAAPQPKE